MTAEPKTTKSRPWVKILLVVSLGLNITVASFIIGISLKDTPPRPSPQNQDAIAFLSFALPAEHRREIRRELVDRRAELRENVDALRGLRVEMIDILQDEPFDIEKIEQLLERQRSHFLNMGELAHDALLRRIDELTPAERQTYIKSLSRDARRQRSSN